MSTQPKPQFKNSTPEQRTRWHLENRTNKTGFLGVKRGSKGGFEAFIKLPRSPKKIYCGYGATAEEAARKYDAKAVELFGVGAVTNFSTETP